MKRHIANFLMATALAAGFASCSSDDDTTPPVSLDQTTITADKGPGQVILRWSIPDKADYYYVKVDYTLPDRSCTRMASVYADSMLIDNLYAKYGPIDFTLQTFKRDGTAGSEVAHISAQSGPAPKTIIATGNELEEFDLKADGLWADNPDSAEGQIEHLIDGDANTFYHMDWHTPTAFPHYIVVDLQKEATAFKFSYVCRNSSGKDNPKEMDIYVSKDFDQAQFEADPTAYLETCGTFLKSLSGLPDGQGATYDYETCPQIVGQDNFRYVWFKVKSATSGSNFISLAELSLKELETSIYDPELEE